MLRWLLVLAVLAGGIVFAASLGLDFGRIQFTPDLLPTDILGVTVFNQREHDFQFHPGPVFTNILLADEINRASPRTQSALLEAMGEGQVSVEGQRHRLPPLFFVIATQNPVEFRGTYPLPEAQLDRFLLQIDVTYPDINAERRINRVRPAIPSKIGRQEWEATQALANAMGLGGLGWSYTHPREIMAEIARLTPTFAGVRSMARIPASA